MGEMVPIRSVKQYFNEFIVERLKGKTKVDTTDLIPIKQDILKEFKNEVFGQIFFKLGQDAMTMTKDELAKLEPVNNILTQTFRKWRRFCILCGTHGLGAFFDLEDLKQILEESEPNPDEVVELPDFEEDVTDTLTEEDKANIQYLETEEAKDDIKEETEQDG